MKKTSPKTVEPGEARADSVQCMVLMRRLVSTWREKARMQKEQGDNNRKHGDRKVGWLMWGSGAGVETCANALEEIISRTNYVPADPALVRWCDIVTASLTHLNDLPQDVKRDLVMALDLLKFEALENAKDNGKHQNARTEPRREQERKNS